MVILADIRSLTASQEKTAAELRIVFPGVKLCQSKYFDR